jgi:hypothetical protein
LGGKSIKYGQDILEVLDAVWASKWVVVIHSTVHQKGEATIAWGNQKAERESEQEVLMRGPVLSVLTAALFPYSLAEWNPWYTPQEQA